MTRRKTILISALMILVTVVTLVAQTAVIVPSIPRPSRNGLLQLDVKRGLSILGSAAFIPISANTALAVSASMTSCAAPYAATCNYVFSTPAGVVTNTTTVATAFAFGNVLLALVETSSTAITRIIYPADFTTTPTLFYACGSAAACAATNPFGGLPVRVAVGSGATAAGILSLTGLPFNSILGCSVNYAVATSGTATALSCAATSGTAATITINGGGPATVTPVSYAIYGF